MVSTVTVVYKIKINQSRKRNSRRVLNVFIQKTHVRTKRIVRNLQLAPRRGIFRKQNLHDLFEEKPRFINKVTLSNCLRSLLLFSRSPNMLRNVVNKCLTAKVTTFGNKVQINRGKYCSNIIDPCDNCYCVQPQLWLVCTALM